MFRWNTDKHYLVDLAEPLQRADRADGRGQQPGRAARRRQPQRHLGRQAAHRHRRPRHRHRLRRRVVAARRQGPVGRPAAAGLRLPRGRGLGLRDHGSPRQPGEPRRQRPRHPGQRQVRRHHHRGRRSPTRRRCSPSTPSPRPPRSSAPRSSTPASTCSATRACSRSREVEITEPGLYLDVAPGNGALFAKAIAARLGLTEG